MILFQLQLKALTIFKKSLGHFFSSSIIHNPMTQKKNKEGRKRNLSEHINKMYLNNK